jgi:hypothetical protein
LGNWLSLRQHRPQYPGRSHKEGIARPRRVRHVTRLGIAPVRAGGAHDQHIQMRDSRWCIVDLVGKRGRVWKIPMPTSTKNAIDVSTSDARVTKGHLSGRSTYLAAAALPVETRSLTSLYRQRMLASSIWRGVLHSGDSSSGLPTTMQAQRARDVATLKRLRS